MLLVGRKPRPEEPILADEEGRFRGLSDAARRLREDLDRIGCPSTQSGHNMTFHALRRSFSTILAEEGVEEGVRTRLDRETVA